MNLATAEVPGGALAVANHLVSDPGREVSEREVLPLELHWLTRLRRLIAMCSDVIHAVNSQLVNG